MVTVDYHATDWNGGRFLPEIPSTSSVAMASRGGAVAENASKESVLSRGSAMTERSSKESLPSVYNSAHRINSLGSMYGSSTSSIGSHSGRKGRKVRKPLGGNWWDEVGTDKEFRPDRGTVPEDGPEREKPQLHLYQAQQPALAYRSDVLEERMLLAAVKRRRNELAKQFGDSAPPGNRSQELLNGGSARFRPRPPAMARSGLEKTDPWTAELASRRAEQKAKVRESKTLSSHHQDWIKNKTAGKVAADFADDELDRVQYFLTHARSLIGKQGGKHYFEEMNDQLKSQIDRHRISKHWAARIDDAHKEIKFIEEMRMRESGRRAAETLTARRAYKRHGPKEMGFASFASKLANNNGGGASDASASGGAAAASPRYEGHRSNATGGRPVTPGALNQWLSTHITTPEDESDKIARELEVDEKFGDLRGVELAEADLEKMGLGQLEPAENEGGGGLRWSNTIQTSGANLKG
eukprot:COSAG05_NODE_205_length_14184_cov_81.700887_1_plen_468_part_00